MIFYIQIDRCMNSVILPMIRRSFEKNFLQMPRVASSRFYETAGALSAGERPTVIGGQFPYGIHIGRYPVVRYIFVLRDPLERVISYYRTIKETKTHPLHQTANLLDIHEFIRRDLMADFQNGQTRYLAERADCGSLPSLGSVREDDLRLAKANLENCHFGIFEYPAESVQFIAQRIGIEPFEFNLTPRVVRATDYSARELDALEDFNLHDCELYEFGRRMFQERIRNL